MVVASVNDLKAGWIRPVHRWRPVLVLDQGRTYWIAVTEPVIWNLSAGAPRETVAAPGNPDGGIEIVQPPS